MGARIRSGKSHRVLIWVVTISLTLAAFYAMNHVVMSVQGLPLDWDLSPAP